MIEISTLSAFAAMQAQAFWAALGLATVPLLIKGIVLVAASLLFTMIVMSICYIYKRYTASHNNAIVPMVANIPADAPNDENDDPAFSGQEAPAPTVVSLEEDQQNAKEQQIAQLEEALTRMREEHLLLKVEAERARLSWFSIELAADTRAQEHLGLKSAKAQFDEAAKLVVTIERAGDMGVLAAGAARYALEEALSRKSALENNGNFRDTGAYRMAYENIIKEKDPDGAIARDCYTKKIALCTLGIKIIEQEKALGCLQLPEAEALALAQEKELALTQFLKRKQKSELALAKMPALAEPEMLVKITN